MVESKIVITAEDRTAAAFASIQRSTEKTTSALTKVSSNMLKLAGVATLVTFFRKNSESTEKWRDEMARLDDTMKKVFNTAANAGQLDPLILGIKVAYSVAIGATTAIAKFAEGIVAFGKDVKLLGTDFFQSGREIAAWKKSVDEAYQSQVEFNKALFQKAPKGYADNKDKEAEGAKEAKRKQLELERELIRLAESRDKLNKKSGQDRYEEELQMRGKMMEAVEREEEQANEKLERERERLQRSVEQISESFMTEQELMRMQYESKQMMLDDAYMRDLLSAEEHTRQKEQLELQHQANMGNISAQGALARRRFEEMNSKQKTMTVLNDLLQLTSGVATNNKAMFQINKVAAIASATISTIDGAQKAYAQYAAFPPLAAAMAGLALAAGLARVSAIKNTSFGDSTSAPSIGGGSAIPVTPAGSIARSPEPVPPMSQAQFAAPEREHRVVNLTINGGVFDAATMRDSVIPALNDALGDGVTLNIRR